MALDPVKNFAISRVATAPSPADSGTTLVVETGDGALFPDPSSSGEYNVVIYPNGEQPTSTNAEIVRVTARTTDTMTIDREEESTSARTVAEGDIVMLAITAKMVSDLSTAVTGVVTEDGTQTLTNKTLTAPALTSPTMSGTWDGWVSAGETWAYASATTITVPSGAASKYQKGDKIKITNNSTTKYFYIISVADTVLTVTGGSDYTVHDSAISANYYSKMETPQGFPLYFSYIPVITTGGNSPTFSSVNAKFSIQGGFVTVSASLTNTSGGTAGSGTGLNITVPVTIVTGYTISGVGVCFAAGTTYKGVWCRGSSTTFYMHDSGMANIDGSALAAEGRQIHFNLSYPMA